MARVPSISAASQCCGGNGCYFPEELLESYGGPRVGGGAGGVAACASLSPPW